MNTAEFDLFMKSLPEMDDVQKEKIYRRLKNMIEGSIPAKGRVIDELSETKFKDGFYCPHCNSHCIVRYGKTNNRQRFKCKDWSVKILRNCRNMRIIRYLNIWERLSIICV